MPPEMVMIEKNLRLLGFLIGDFMKFKDGLLVGVGVAVGMAGVNIGLNLLFSLIARIFG
jgi:hypothetical protein